ncbi:MAG: GGDEF domain-containing protein [Pirellulales bacterium]|nr:GGDEF domain-containing protein [Pirellulales bacterium]
MTVASQPAILLLSADRREVRRWTAALETVAAQLWLSADDVPTGEALVARPLVVVTEGPDEALRHPRLQPLDTLEHGLVRLGRGDSSEVIFALGQFAEPTTPVAAAIEVDLPVDVSARELALVCRLLGEIVWLRRAVRAGGHEREQLREQAHTDELTGLPNRRAWDDALARLTDDELRSCVVAIFDLDHFKQVNDRAGHLVGDTVLRAAAGALAGSIRRHDSVARLGGDEFGLILTELAPASVEGVLARLRAEIARSTSEIITPSVTVSVGYAVVAPSEAEKARAGAVWACFAAADRALRQAKLAGRDRAIAAPAAEP